MIVKRVLKSLLSKFGYDIQKVDPSVLPPKTMDGALETLSRKHKLNTIIDIGASNGVWSLLAMKYYPSCQYLLVEAQPVHQNALDKFVAAHPNSQYVLAAAGDGEGHINFDATYPFSGQASFTPYSSNNIIVPVTTIDMQVEKRSLPGPYLLKLDTHGFEAPILKGAPETLKKTEVLIVECYNFRISSECLIFYEMCDYLAKLGFRCMDLADALWRPYDRSFWQMDLIFVRKDRPEFSYLGYH